MTALLTMRGVMDSMVNNREVQQTAQVLISKNLKRKKNNKPKWLQSAHHLNIVENSRVTDAAMVETMRMAVCFFLLASLTSVRKGSTAGKVKIKYKAKNLNA